MQSLWSRAGQAHRCGCRACSTVVGGLGRRATTATRRKATFAELFTACYSSVFATAAVVDAVSKEDRRRDLDRQLEEARRELVVLQERGNVDRQPDDPESADLTTKQMDVLWRSLKKIYNDRPFMKEIHTPATLSVSDLLTSLKLEHYNCPSDTSLRTSRQIDYEQLERAIIAEEGNEGIRSRESRNQTHLIKESQSVENLTYQLMRRADILDRSSSPSPSFDEAGGLLRKGCLSFTFRSIDPTRARENTTALNRRLRSLITTSNLSLKERVGRVCYNMLVSMHAPDMHTYNTLIVAFGKTGHHSFADTLVNSFFHDSLLKPTPSTFVAILNHYKNTNNHGRFLRTLASLTGLDDKVGAKMKRRHVEDVEASWVLQLWAADHRRRTLTGDWFWEHVPLHQQLIEAVLSGLVHFKLFDQAASFFVSCLRSGTALSTRTVNHLLDECVAALDWKAAVRLVRGFTNCDWGWRALLLSKDGDWNSQLIERTYALLDLCGIRRSDGPASDSCLANLEISGSKLAQFLATLEGVTPASGPSSLGDLTNTGILAPDDISRSKSRLLQVESLYKEYVSVRKTTQSIESKLLYPEFSPEFRSSTALHVGNAAGERSLQLSQEFVKLVLPNRGKMNRLRSRNVLEDCRMFERDTWSWQDSEKRAAEAVEESKRRRSQDVERAEAEPEADRQVELESALGSHPESQAQLQLESQSQPPSSELASKPPTRPTRPDLGQIFGDDVGFRAKPRRLLSWPVAGERGVYSEEGRWVA